MQYLVRHLTRFTYAKPVSESVMELRMQPLSGGRQRLVRFDISTTPRARVFAYRDYVGNAVHYFDIPGHHTQLDITADAIVDITLNGTGTAAAGSADLPESLPVDTWQQIDAEAANGDSSDWLTPSRFACETPALQAFARSIGLANEHGPARSDDPLSLLRALTRTLFEQFAYVPRATKVDSPIDHALEARAGVCQDFAHIMTTLVRGLGIPCRYVSGYLAPRESGHDRSLENATHAWVEALLPGLGWVGFDPTNNTLARERHIVVAVGRDYGDVPPTRGVFKGGEVGSELGVAVSITRPEVPVQAHDLVPTVSWVSSQRPIEDRLADDFAQQQQQQQ